MASRLRAHSGKDRSHDLQNVRAVHSAAHGSTTVILACYSSFEGINTAAYAPRGRALSTVNGPCA